MFVNDLLSKMIDMCETFRYNGQKAQPQKEGGMKESITLISSGMKESLSMVELYQGTTTPLS